MTALKLLVVTVGATSVAGLLVWRGYAMRAPHAVSHAVIVHDRSGSAGGTESCSAAVALAGDLLASRSLGRGSTFVVLATGDRRSGNEPLELARYDVPVTRSAMEGRRAAGKRREQLLADLDSRCQQLDWANTSPVFLAAKRGTEHLRAAGCSAQAPCFLSIQSDLDETVELEIAKALAGTRQSRRRLPVPIDNSGIRVRACGLAETGPGSLRHGGELRATKPRGAASADRVRAVWMALFTNPDLVSFEPHCPKVVIPPPAPRSDVATVRP